MPLWRSGASPEPAARVVGDTPTTQSLGANPHLTSGTGEGMAQEGEPGALQDFCDGSWHGLASRLLS